MSINLVTYANQTVTPTNDAIIYEMAIDQNGIFHGCNVTVSGNNVNITGGYGIVCGREFVIESESIPVTLAPSGTNDGRLYVRLDLADADAPIQLLTAQGNPLPPLEQDTDVNYTNGAYEMELATFTVGVSALSDIVETYETITGTKKRETLTLTFNGCTNEDSICTRSGGVVSLTFVASGASVTTSWSKVGNVLGSLPSAIITGVGMANNTAIQFRVTTAGEINIRGASSLSSQTIRCNLTWTV